MTARKRCVQAFVELRSEDPEATSALAVARRRLAAGRGLGTLRRFRVFEITGSGLEREALADRLHGSAQFYNPAKERCTLRAEPEEPPPAAADDALVLVFERGGERRPGAERWWRHAAGERVEVREGVVWALGFEPGVEPGERAAELAATRDRAHGLFANPNVQESRVCAGASPPLGWMTQRVPRAPRRGRRST